MELSIIIVTWNSREDIERCIDSVFTHTKNINFEVIVVDNASSDDTPDYLGQLAEQNKIVCIPSQENLGFARGNNKGLQQARGDYILFLNPDTYLEDNALVELLTEYKKHPSLGILAPQLHNPDGTIQRSCRSLPTLLDQMIILFKLHNIFKLKKYFMLDFDHTSRRSVGQVMGAAMLMSKKVLASVGEFDSSFKRNFEEVDLCARVHHHEYTIVFTPETHVVHAKGASFKQVGLITKQRYWNHDVIRYFRKRGQHKEVMILRMLQFPALAIAAIVQTLIWLRIPGFKRLKNSEL